MDNQPPGFLGCVLAGFVGALLASALIRQFERETVRVVEVKNN